MRTAAVLTLLLGGVVMFTSSIFVGIALIVVALGLDYGRVAIQRLEKRVLELERRKGEGS